MDYVYSIKMSNGTRGEAVGDDSLQLRMGDFCVIRKEHTLEYVQILQQRHGGVTDPDKVRNIPRIQRVATMYDRGVATENEARAKSAYRTSCQMVEDMKLPMKLLNASFSFDQKLVTILFTADGRVDFRELVKELSKALGTRLELRQIGVRDETGICGGIAVCGQVLCCSRFLREFSSINVRMAKDQDLSLTPGTISGVCGRLKCCLKYEHDGYVEMEKEMPRRGEMCECAKGRGRVSDRNILTRKVTLALEDGGTVTLPIAEVKFRGRFGKRSDAPDAAEPALPENDAPVAAEPPVAEPPPEMAEPPVAEPDVPVAAAAPQGEDDRAMPHREGGRKRHKNRNKRNNQQWKNRDNRDSRRSERFGDTDD